MPGSFRCCARSWAGRRDTPGRRRHSPHKEGCGSRPHSKKPSKSPPPCRCRSWSGPGRTPSQRGGRTPAAGAQASLVPPARSLPRRAPARRSRSKAAKARRPPRPTLSFSFSSLSFRRIVSVYTTFREAGFVSLCRFFFVNAALNARPSCKKTVFYDIIMKPTAHAARMTRSRAIYGTVNAL